MTGQEPLPAEDRSEFAPPPGPTLDSVPVAGAGTRRPISRVGRALSKVVMFFLLGYMLLMWWTVVLSWYVSMHVVFGVFFLLFHLIRRDVRYQKKQDLRHREIIQATQIGDLNVDDLQSEKIQFAGPITFTGAYRRTRKIWMRLFPEL